MSKSSQFELLRERRFAGLFYTQFLGAFNDNLFKSALSLIFVYSGLIAAQNTNLFLNAAAGLFILPFFLFSATAGQLADKYEKSHLVRIIKIVEIFIALAGGVAVYVQSVVGMLTVLFMLGVQSTFFGPLKFAILPQQLKESELIGGNAQIEMGTFVAILLGTLIGGIVAAQSEVSLLLPLLVVAVAVIGYGASRFIPHTPATSPEMKIGWNLFNETFKLIKLARAKKAVFQSILAVSWFWLLGSVFLTQIPNLVKLHLAGGTTVVTLILSVFTISIALGSLACERLSGHKIEIGLVPFGAFGLSAAGVDLYFAIAGMSTNQAGGVLGWTAFLGADGSFRVLLDMGLIGLFGGLFIVPLYALIQVRTPEDRRARIIAANNILNALFMVTAAGGAALLLDVAGWNIPDLLLAVALLNLVVAIYIFRQVPEFSMRFLIWLLSHTMYRVTHEGLEKIPEKGSAIIVCNHVTFVDALLLAGAVRRPIRFIMFKPIFDIPVLNFVFRTGGAIPIVSQHVDKAAYDKAFEQIQEGLQAGDLLCIFPEGALTLDGQVAEFKSGIERILAQSPVPVVPMALRGLWGSFFSRDEGAFKRPKRFWSRVDVVAGEPIDPGAASTEALRESVLALRGAAA